MGGGTGSYMNIDGYTFNLVRNKHECRELNPKSIKRIVSKAELNLRLLDHRCRVLHAELSQFYAMCTLYEQDVRNTFFFPN